ncbi:MAG: glycosyltransferase family 4 protein [Chloroherpetonaceae bacterium]|nr:glycosyltransferase family 4 protein [Chloroherpetonaceae bacterium]
MKLTFLMNGVSLHPVGGVKIMLEFANRLAEKGHEINILCATVGHPYHKNTSLKYQLKRKGIYLLYQWGWKGGPLIRWFKLHPSIRYSYVPDFRSKYLPDADFIISSSWEESLYLHRLSKSKGIGMQIMHEYERFMLSSPEIKEIMTLNYQSEIRFVSTSLVNDELLKSCGAKAVTYIPNAIDDQVFNIKEPIDSPLRCAIGFPYRFQPYKGYQDMLATLDILHKQIPNGLQFWCFGSHKPSRLPEYLSFYESISDTELCSLMNQTSIFINPSHFEGFGLPSIEAMACGCALITADNGGCRSFAMHEQTALIVEPSQPKMLAQSILRLIHDERLRITLAEKAQPVVKEFSWGKSISEFEGLLNLMKAA